MSRLAARFAQAMLDADNELLKDYTFTFYAAGTTNPLPIYSDANKSSIVNAAGQATSDQYGNLAVWIDDVAFDLYYGSILVQSNLYPIATPGDADEPVVYTQSTPATISSVIAHNFGRTPQVAVTDADTEQRIFAFDCLFPTPNTAIIKLLTPRRFTVTLS